jgi:hypothetical protein
VPRRLDQTTRRRILRAHDPNALGAFYRRADAGCNQHRSTTVRRPAAEVAVSDRRGTGTHRETVDRVDRIDDETYPRKEPTWPV